LTKAEKVKAVVSDVCFIVLLCTVLVVGCKYLGNHVSITWH
jgi:hypothetical protein